MAFIDYGAKHPRLQEHVLALPDPGREAGPLGARPGRAWPAFAAKGIGVFESLELIAKQVLEQLRKPG
jgi:hypothetical protein